MKKAIIASTRAASSPPPTAANSAAPPSPTSAPSTLVHTLVTDTTAPADEVAALEGSRHRRPYRLDSRVSSLPSALAAAVEVATTSSAARSVWASPLYRGATVALFLSGLGTSAAAPQITLFLVNDSARLADHGRAVLPHEHHRSRLLAT